MPVEQLCRCVGAMVVDFHFLVVVEFHFLAFCICTVDEINSTWGHRRLAIVEDLLPWVLLLLLMRGRTKVVDQHHTSAAVSLLA